MCASKSLYKSECQHKSTKYSSWKYHKHLSMAIITLENLCSKVTETKLAVNMDKTKIIRTPVNLLMGH